MLDSTPVVSFIPTRDAAKARAFYEGTLGLQFVADDGFAVVFRLAAGGSLRIVRVDTLTPQPFTVLGWQPEDVEAAVAGLVARGVGFERVPGLPQDELGIWSAPGGGKVAWFKDPDGNTLSLSGPA